MAGEYKFLCGAFLFCSWLFSLDFRDPGPPKTFYPPTIYYIKKTDGWGYYYVGNKTSYTAHINVRLHAQEYAKDLKKFEDMP